MNIDPSRLIASFTLSVLVSASPLVAKVDLVEKSGGDGHSFVGVMSS